MLQGEQGAPPSLSRAHKGCAAGLSAGGVRREPALAAALSALPAWCPSTLPETPQHPWARFYNSGSTEGPISLVRL